MISYSESLPVSIDKVWKHFLDKIEHPENFVPGVSEVEIREKNDEYVIRAMSLTTPDGIKNRVVEKITAIPYQVRFLILEHPVFEGYVDNFAECKSDHETIIKFAMNWTNKNTGETFSNLPLMETAVKKTIDYIVQKEGNKQ